MFISRQCVESINAGDSLRDPSVCAAKSSLAALLAPIRLRWRGSVSWSIPTHDSLAFTIKAQAIFFIGMPLLAWRPKSSKVGDQQLQSVPYDSLVGNDQPKDLWDRAYRLLREDKSNSQLVVAYERILASELNIVASPVASADWGNRDRSRQVSELIAKKLKIIEDTRWRLQLGRETVELKAQVNKVVKTVIWAQGFVSSAVSAGPHSALAWAGVSLLLPLLLNPTSQNKALVDGLDYISTLIARFTLMEKTYQQYKSTRSTSSDSMDLTDLDRSFELQVTKLYSQVLAYQARVVCQLPRNALMRYGRDVLKVDEWSTMLADIKTTEFNCSALSEIVNAGRLDDAWKEQEARMDKLFCSQEEHYRSIQQKTEQMAVDLKQSIEEQRDWHRTEEEIRCLQALCTTTYLDHKDLNPDRVHGTCQWFLKNGRFHEWAESDSSELLWVTADPGCGKSVLSKSLVDCELQSTLSLTTAYYFFKDASPEQRSATHALCALVHQICSQNHELLRKAVDAYRDNGGMLTLSFAWMWQLLLAVAHLPEAGEIVCVVDALDECQEKDRETLIGSLNDFYASQKRSEGQLKFLVTSRPYSDIEESFDHDTIRLAGEDESETIKHEINLVIKDRVSKIASRKRLEGRTQAALQDRLLQNENRTYLWLHLTLDSIEKAFGLATPQKMIIFIRELPRTINQAYEAMLLRCPQPEKARKLLHIILAARRPLTLREMNMAFNIEIGQKSREEVDLFPEVLFGSYVKNLCGLLVRIFDSKVFLLHQTVKEFLLPRTINNDTLKSIDSNGVWKHSMEPEESNLILASGCLYYLSFTIFDERPNIFYCGRFPRRHNCKSIQRLSKYRYAGARHDFFNYAAYNWVDHFRLARTEREMTEMWSYICDAKASRFINWFSSWLVRDNCTLLGQKYATEFLASMVPRDRSPSIFTLTHPSFLSAILDRLDLSPLNLAFAFEHYAIARQILEKNDKVDSQSLILAARAGNVSVIRMLLEAGVSIETRSSNGYTPLMEAADSGMHLAVQELLNAGAQIGATNLIGETALTMATSMGNSQVVDVLLKANDRECP